MPSNNFKAVYTVHTLMIIRSASHQSDALGKTFEEFVQNSIKCEEENREEQDRQKNREI